MSLQAWKGHGTENDFVVLPDLDGALSMSASFVRALCDRRAGIGADGVLRVLRTKLATEPDVLDQAGVAEFFMDYRNADGSIAEMCGNGARVFARYLQDAGLIDGPTVIATRGGPKQVTFDGAEISVVMGPEHARAEHPTVTVAGLVGSRPGLAYDLPNPHVVVELETVDELMALDLSQPPIVESALPEGQNVEFVVRTGPAQLQFRVHERGSGETRSCGTGVCAAVAAVAEPTERTARWAVDVPGGRCGVWWQDGDMVLSGPAVLVAAVELTEDWLADHR